MDPDWFCRVKIANVGSSRVSWKWDSTNKKDIIIAFYTGQRHGPIPITGGDIDPGQSGRRPLDVPGAREAVQQVMPLLAGPPERTDMLPQGGVGVATS